MIKKIKVNFSVPKGFEFFLTLAEKMLKDVFPDTTISGCHDNTRGEHTDGKRMYFDIFIDTYHYEEIKDSIENMTLEEIVEHVAKKHIYREDAPQFQVYEKEME